MAAKPGSENGRVPTRSKPRAAEARERIRADLERRGVGPDYSKRISSHLQRVSEGLSPKAYEAVLASVALAHGGRREEAAAAPGNLTEIQRLMTGFAGELRKLDEAMQILSAYVRRIRKSALAQSRDTLH